MAKVIFLQELAEEWLGIMYISSMLKSRGHSCDVYVEPLEKENIVKKVISDSPDIVAFSCLTHDFYWAINKARQIRKHSKAFIIFGGTHITLNADKVFPDPNIDAICLGEGEYPLTELADAIDNNEDYSTIKNLWVCIDGKIVKNELRFLIEDLDFLPFPDRKFYYKYPFFKKRGKRPLHFGRGCPYDCTYCHNSSKKALFKNKGKYVRWRSKESVLAEIGEIKKNGYVKVLHFIDDSFGINSKWLIDFIKSLMKESGERVALQASMRADMVTEELCEVFKDYGIQYMRLRIAVECGDEDFRIKTIKKIISNQALVKATEYFNRYKIDFLTYNIVGLPGESLALALKTLELNIKLKPALAICFMFQPYPGTELADYALSIGSITKEMLMKLGTREYGGMYHSRSVLIQKDIKKIENLHKVFGFLVNKPLFLPLAKFFIRFRIFFPFFSLFYKLHIRAILRKRQLRDKY